MKQKFTKRIMQTFLNSLRPMHLFTIATLSLFSLQSNAQSPTAPALGFNVFLQQGATLINNETEGPVAIGGDLTLSQGSYQVSTNYTGTFKVNNIPVTLVIGGKVNFNGGNGITVDQNGYVQIGDCGSSKVWYKDQNNAFSPIRITPGADYNGSPRINLQANSQQLGVSETVNPVCGQTVIDFASAFTQMKASSTSMSACTDNTELTDPNGNVIPHTGLPHQVKINLHTGINTLNLAGADMNNVTDFIYNTKPDANHVFIINVNAPGTFNWSVYNSGGIGFQECPYVLYNFYNTTALNVVGNGAVEGTVFAPFADIVKTSNQSNIEGQIIAQSYVQNGGENHYPPFTTTIPSCGVVCNLSVSGTKTDITCNGAENGSIDITATGNSGALTYSWNDGATTEDRTGLSTGDYSVQVSDAAGCKATSQTFTISQPNAINISGTTVNVTTVGGSDGSIDVTVTGGTGPYTYKWNDGATTEDRTGLSKGDYAVTVTDAHGCSDGKAFTVNEPNCTISVNGTSKSISCNGSNNGSIDVTVSGNTGNVSYLWNDGATTEDRTGLSSGNYSVQASDAAGCKVTSQTFTISEPTALNLSGVKTDVTTVSGSDGSIDITVTGGTGPYTYKWNDGATTEDRTGLTKGTYSVTVTDANGCTATQAFIINQPDCSISVTGKAKPTTCFGGNDGSINITVSGNTGNVNYLWNDGATTEDRTNLTAGKYSVTATDSKGCSVVSQTITVKQPKKIKVSGVVTGQKTKYVCDGTITLSATGGTAPYTYTWSDGYIGSSRTNLCMGTYTGTVKDKKGCTCTFKFRVPCEDTTINKGKASSATAVSLNTNVSVAPNPTSDVVKITINTAVAGNATITVFDFAGRALIQQKISLSNGSNQHQVSLGTLAKGVYNIQVVTGNSSNVFKVVLN